MLQRHASSSSMPFSSYHASSEDPVRSAMRMVQEGHVEAPSSIRNLRKKVLGDPRSLRRFDASGAPIMAHVGLMLQYSALSGYCVQGRDAVTSQMVFDGALALQGPVSADWVHCCAPQYSIPTIGIGAGPARACDDALAWEESQVSTALRQCRA